MCSGVSVIFTKQDAQRGLLPLMLKKITRRKLGAVQETELLQSGIAAVCDTIPDNTYASIETCNWLQNTLGVAFSQHNSRINNKGNGDCNIHPKDRQQKAK